MNQPLSNIAGMRASIPEKIYERILIEIIQESPFRILEVPAVWELLGFGLGDEIYERYLDEIRSASEYRQKRVAPGGTVADEVCLACRTGTLISTGNKDG